MSEELVNDEGQNSPYLRSAGAWSPLSESEASCQDRLANYKLLDSERDDAFDDITEVAITVTSSPVSFTCFVDWEKRREFIKSAIGLEIRQIEHGPTPEDKTAVLSIQAIKTARGDDAVFYVEDAEHHPAFSQNPLVKAHGLKSFAGAVLRGPDGTPVGVLWVADRAKRALSEPHRRQLHILARSAEAAMEQHLERTRRPSRDWAEIQSLGAGSSAANDLYVAACPEASAGAPLTPFEEKCLHELASYRILDTDPDAAFDDITEVAAVCCSCPVAICSLVDYNNRRGFFKSHFGLDLKYLPYGPTPEDKAAVFCVQACKIIQGDDVFEVEDATRHQIFCNNPAVKQLGLKFYAGAILRSPAGLPLGTLCVLDKEKRHLTEQQKRQLAMLARSTVEAMEAHRRKEEDAAAQAEGKAPAEAGAAAAKEAATTAEKQPAAPPVPTTTGAAPAEADKAAGSALLVAAWAIVFLVLLVGTALALATHVRRMRGEEHGGPTNTLAAWLRAAGLSAKYHGEQL